MSTLAQVTSAVSFLSMAASLWLGCYVVTRSPRSRLAWQAGLTLWSLAGLFVTILLAIGDSTSPSRWPRWPLTLTLAIWYHLSLETLPPERRTTQRRFLPVVYGLAALLDVLLLQTSLIASDRMPGVGAYTTVFERRPLFAIWPIFLIGLALLMLYNFWTARRAVRDRMHRKQLNSLVRGTFLGVLAAVYWTVAISLGVSVPALPIVLALGLGVGMLGHGIARYSALIDGRILRFDFDLSALLMLALSAIYLAATWFLFQPAWSIAAAIVVVALTIFTHTSFEFARRLLDRPFVRLPARALRATLRRAASDLGERKSVEESLRSALAALVVGVNARWGAIALRDGGEFVVRASFHGERVGERLSAHHLNVRELTVLSPEGSSDWPLAVIAPMIADRDAVGAILLGQPRGGTHYSEGDLDLVAEAADRLAELIRYAQEHEAHARQIGDMLEAFRAREYELQSGIDGLLYQAKAAAPSPQQVAEVENAMRRLYDYSYLGEHPLARNMLAHDHATTHIDRGKALNAVLVTAIEKLRPAAVEPRELPPREWHPYLILRDAYLRGDANRDIMSRLYVSEATFHRTRRSALRAVTKALHEMDLTPVQAD